MDKNLHIERIINENIDVRKMGLKLVGKEYSTKLGRIDILTKDVNDSYVPIEIKLGTASDSAVGQILRYIHVTGADKGIIMANDFTDGVKAVSDGLNVELIRYTIDVIIDNESVVLDNVLSDIRKEINEDCFYEYDPINELGGGLFAMFILACINITNNEDDFIKQHDIYDMLDRYIIYNGGGKNIYPEADSVKIFNEILCLKYNLDPLNIKTGVSGNFVYYGVEFKPICNML